MMVVTGVLCMAVISAILFSNLERARHFMEENRKTMTRYPEALADYMNEHNMGGRVFNSYGTGGYLIYRLSPHVQVYIDGRTDILYPVEHMKWYAAVTRSPEKLQTELLKFDVNQIVWTHRSHEFHDILMDIGDFDLEFMDGKHALYVRGTGNFPLLGQLISQPACWRSGLSGQVLAEGRRMEEILPYYSRLFPFVNLMLEYQQADDKSTFLNSFSEKENWLDEMFRFTGFRRIEAGQNSYAIEMFASIKDRRAQDYLATATAALKDENFQILAQVLNEFSSKSWQHVNDRDLQILFQLYKNLAEFRILTSFESLSMDNLHKVLIEDSISDLPFELNVSSFCPSTAISHL